MSYGNPHGLDTSLMALTGLYFDDKTSEIRCYFCRHSFKDFKKNEEIVSLHYKMSRNCPLMKRRRTSNIPLNEVNLDLTLPPLVYDECGTGHRYTNASSVYRKPAYPQFLDFDKRIKSYQDWPLQMHQKPEELAEAGLFYTNEGDKVKCYDCGLGLKNWEPDDQPWIEHAKYSKNCYFINFVKGYDFSQNVRQKKVAGLQKNRSDKEMEELFKDEKCKNCDKRIAEVEFLPCNHLVLCAICAISKNECIVCKRPVECRLRLYY